MWTGLRQWWLDASHRGLGKSASRQPPSRGRPPPSNTEVLPVLHTKVATSTRPTDRVPVTHRFTAHLVGVTDLSAEDPQQGERRVLQRLEEMAHAIDEEPLVPRLPAVLPKLLRLMRREDMAAGELAALLGREPALLGEVMRQAHSARYWGGERPTLPSLEAAVAVLGLRGIQQVVSRAVMTPVFDRSQGRFSAAAGTLLWNQAERCAHVCAFLRAGKPDVFEAYLAGMVSNAGLIVALRLLDQAPVLQAPASSAFHDGLAIWSALLSARIARHWSFPEEVALAVASLAPGEDGGIHIPSEVGGLAVALHRADRASKSHVLASPRCGTQDEATVGPDDDIECLGELARAFG